MPNAEPSAIPDHIGKPGGLLTDLDILKALKEGYLLAPGTHIIANIRRSSYELRIGKQFQILKYKDGKIVHEGHELTGDEKVVQIPPGQTYKLFVEEELRIPPNVLASVYVLGPYFASGLAAEHTYADPGFSYKDFYITMSNISSRTLRLERGKPLAKLHFHKLGGPVDPKAPKPRATEVFVEYKPSRSLNDLTKKEIVDLITEFAHGGYQPLEMAYVLCDYYQTLGRLKLIIYCLGGLAIAVGLGMLILWILSLAPVITRIPEEVRSALKEFFLPISAALGTVILIVVKKTRKEFAKAWGQACFKLPKISVIKLRTVERRSRSLRNEFQSLSRQKFRAYFQPSRIVLGMVRRQPLLAST